MPESPFRFPSERFWWTARKYNAWDQFTDEDFIPATVSATVTDEVLPTQTVRDKNIEIEEVYA